MIVLLVFSVDDISDLYVKCGIFISKPLSPHDTKVAIQTEFGFV